VVDDPAAADGLSGVFTASDAAAPGAVAGAAAPSAAVCVAGAGALPLPLKSVTYQPDPFS